MEFGKNYSGESNGIKSTISQRRIMTPSSKQYPCVITGVHVNVLSPSDEKAVATASVEINNVIIIHDFRIICVNGCHSVRWPMSMETNSDHRHVVIALNKGFREEVEEKLVNEYLRIVNDEKLTSLLNELESLKTQERNAREEGKEALANALEKAIEHLDAEIRQN